MTASKFGVVLGALTQKVYVRNHDGLRPQKTILRIVLLCVCVFFFWGGGGAGVELNPY